MAKCTIRSCPYHGNRTEVPYSGKAPVDILIVGEAPGTTEEEKGKPFIGKSGQVLNALLESVGMDRSMVYITNASRCRIKPEDATKDVNEALRQCRVKLDRVIKVLKPKVIVSLGAVALRQLTGQQKILSNRGRVFGSEWGVPVLCVVHPAYVLRGAQKGFPNIPLHQMAQKERMIFEDFAMVKDVLSGKGTERKIDTTGYREGNAADLKPFSKAKHVAIDFETNSLNPFEPNAKILSVALCKEDGTAITLFPKGGKFPAEFRRIMENPKIAKIVANRSFEEKWMRHKLGITMKGPVHDVLVMAHLIDENGSGYDLETLAGIYTPLKKIKDVIGGKAARGKKIAEADRDTLIKYNAVDADATFRLFQALKIQLQKDPRLIRYYARFVIPVQNMFADCFMNGVKIDTKELRETEEWFGTKMEEARERALARLPQSVQNKHAEKLDLSRRHLMIDAIFKPIGFNYPAHPDHLTPKTAEPKVSKEHLALIRDHHRCSKRAQELIDAYLEYGTLRKFRSTYLTALWGQLKQDGCVYPETILNRTVTGRTVMKDPAIQVIPARGDLSKKIKRIFVADRGWVMIGRDLGQSEIRIAGWLAKDPVILKALRDNIDVHTKTASIVSRKPVEKISKLDRFRAKAINFGFIYGMGAPKFQQYAKATYGLDLTLAECEEIRRAFFAKPTGYWRLPIYHEFQRAFVHKNGFARSPIGRKRNLPEVYSSEFSFRSGAERQAINFPIQSFSNDLGLIAMFLFHEAVQNDPELKGNVKVSWFIHDAVYAFAKKKYRVKAMKLLKECMEKLAPAYIEKHFGIKIEYPVTSDGHYGPNWADQEEVD